MGGWSTTEQDKRTVLQAMLVTCDGHFVERGDGAIILRVGKFVAPTVVITDDDIIGYFVQRGLSSEDKINRATAKYTSPDGGYVSVETDAVFDKGDLAFRPGAPRSAQIDMTWVQSTGQASRLLKREMLRQQELTIGRLTLKLTGVNAMYERWVRVQSNTIPRLSNKIIEVRKATVSLIGNPPNVEIEFIGSGAYIDTYDPIYDESSPPTIIGRLSTISLPMPTGVAAVTMQVNDPSGQSTVVLRVSWDLPLLNGVAWGLDYVVQYRVQDTGGGSPGDWTQETFTSPTAIGSLLSVTTKPVAAGTIYDVQVFSLGSGGTFSAASAVVVADTTNVPTAPVILTATPHAGYAALNATASNSPSVAKLQFWYATTGTAFASASLAGAAFAALPGGSATLNYFLSPGSYDFWVTAQNSAGTNSPPTGPVNAAVT